MNHFLMVCALQAQTCLNDYFNCYFLTFLSHRSFTLFLLLIIIGKTDDLKELFLKYRKT